MKNAPLTAQKNITLLLVLALGIAMGYGQEKSKNAVFIGFSPLARIEDNLNDGLGINWTVGYQKNIWNNRLRLVPSLNFGFYDGKGILDAPDVLMNAASLKINLNVDALKISSFSIFVGSGLGYNYSAGLDRTYGYFNSTSFAVNGVLGIKVNPEKQKHSYELILLDFSSRTGFHEMSFLKFRWVRRL